MKNIAKFMLASVSAISVVAPIYALAAGVWVEAMAFLLIVLLINIAVFLVLDSDQRLTRKD